jgi:rRNA maturation protein Nop10
MCHKARQYRLPKTCVVNGSVTESDKDQVIKRFSNPVFDFRCLICGTYTLYQKSPVIKIPHSVYVTTPNLSPFITVYYKTRIYNEIIFLNIDNL